jgi:hypothetical protein
MSAMRWPAIFILTALSGIAFGQKPTITKKEGHLSPLIVKVTFLSGESRTLMLQGVGWFGGIGDTHAIRGIGEGNSLVSIWLDTIAAIKDTNADDALFILKSGTERRLSFVDNNSVQSGLKDYYIRNFYVANQDGGTERLDLAQVKSVEFAATARRDKDGNAMFDQWRYSPFTGEKLPEN